MVIIIKIKIENNIIYFLKNLRNQFYPIYSLIIPNLKKILKEKKKIKKIWININNSKKANSKEVLSN